MKRQRSSSTSGPNKKPRTQKSTTVAATVKKELRKRTDWKYTDMVTIAANSQSAGTITSLFGNLIRGDNGINNFLGNTIIPQAVLVKYFIHTSELRNVVRVMIFQWMDSAIPSLSGVLQHTNLPTLSPTLITNKPYIRVLYDHTHQFAPSAGGDVLRGEGVTDPVTVYIPGKRLKPLRYNASTNFVQDGQIYILHVSDDAVTPSPQISYCTRVTFDDS